MSTNSDYVDDNNTVVTVPTKVISNTVKFWVYLVVLIPSIICSLFALYYILLNRTQRKTLHNHGIAVVLLIGFVYQVTIYPWMLYYYCYQGVWHRSTIFCTIWSFIDWGLCFTQTILFAWATIERHILIFHHKWIATKRKRFCIHYLPFTVLLLYCLVFYIVVSFFPSCANYYDDTYMICVGLCFTDTYVLDMWDTVVHQVSPNIIIVVFSLALLVRVLHQKHRMHRSLQWRKHRKMTVQLLSISVLYLLFDFPLAIMNFMYLCGFENDIDINVYEYMLFFNYLMLLFFPFACVLSLPQVGSKLKNMLHFRWQTTLIVPVQQ